MKNRYILYLALCSTLAAGAQSKLDFSANMMVHDLKLIREGVELANVDQRLRPAILSRGEAPTIGVIVELNKGYNADDITLNGEAEIVQQIDNLAIVSIAVDKLEALAALDAVKSVEAGMLNKPKMSFARAASNIDQVQTGEGLSQAYTGEGVVVGLMDTGIDPCHANFLNSDGTETRVKRAYAYGGSNGTPTRSATNADGIAAFGTDNKSEEHGTHVAGIMTGSYRGNGNYGLSNKIYTDSPIPFYGVATDAEIVMSGGNLYDTNIINGVTKVIEYAESVNKPVVVNLSLGSNVGPHDGTTSSNKMLAALGKRGIICVSSGNEGDTKLAATLTFSRLSKTRTIGFDLPTDNSGVIANMWNDTNEVLDAYFIIYDLTTGQEVYSLPIPNLLGGGLAVGGSSTSSAYTKNEYFSKAFTSNSYIYFSSEVSNDNNRYYIAFNMTLKRDATSANNLVAGIKITGKSSGEVFCTISDGEFTNNGISSWSDGSTIGTINSMACSDNVLAVGSYNTSNICTSLAGETWGAGQAKNDVSTFTSYGRYNGQDLPHICAPGSLIVSSLNYYYSHTDSDYTVSARADVNNRTNRWGAMQGTSMSSPLMAGIAALWLQANPSLNIQDIINIATSTANQDSYVKGAKTEAARMQWGAGKVDALAGLKMALNYDGISNITADESNALIINKVEDGVYNVFVANEGAIRATLYAIDGSTVASASSETSELTLNAPGLRSGIYVISVDGQHSHNTRKFVVK